jgi:phenylalanyl-tRNA synthetase alpha chain
LEVVERRCLEVLRQLGFEVANGPEVEHPYYNFDALNIPEHHPARDMQDTFWVQGGLLLRSHTTTVQARILEANREKGASALPIRIASMGRVYRNEAVDATHLAMFHQLEGLWVDRGLTFAHLKGVLDFVARSLFGDRKVRFKPKFYPYTEPSVGVDLACGVCGGKGCEACHGAGWVTILGAGMVHPKVFKEFGFDPNEVSGIAFGLGTTRMAAQWSGVTRPKSMYESDLRVHDALSRGGEG